MSLYNLFSVPILVETTPPLSLCRSHTHAIAFVGVAPSGICKFDGSGSAMEVEGRWKWKCDLYQMALTSHGMVSFMRSHNPLPLRVRGCGFARLSKPQPDSSQPPPCNTSYPTVGEFGFLQLSIHAREPESK